MKPLAFLLFLAISTTLATQSDFLHIDQALKQSAEEDKPIMLVFSGSDWCKPCIQLKKEILETEAFSETANHLIFLYLDFPYRKANRLSKEETSHNEELAERYNKDGHFPKIRKLPGMPSEEQR